MENEECAPPTRHRGKSAVIRERLIEIAHERGPSSRMPTVRELCTLLGTTPATLDGVLAELEARQILWRRQGSGIFVSPQLLRRSAALLFNPAYLRGMGASPFWGLLVDAIQAGARARDIDLSFHFTNAPGDITASGEGAPPSPVYGGLEAEIRDGRIQGVLAVGLQGSAIHWIEDKNVPTVAYAGYGPCVVGHDIKGMLRLQVSSLAEQGCQRIGLWLPVVPFFHHNSPEPSFNQALINAFQEALADQGLPFDRTLVQSNAQRIPPGGGVVTTSVQEQGFETATLVFAPDSLITPPDGIAITDDMMTLGAIAALRGLGVRIGEDVRIATHANVGSPVLLGYEERMTLTLIDPAAIAEQMLDLLDLRLAGEDTSEALLPLPTTLVLPTR